MDGDVPCGLLCKPASVYPAGPLPSLRQGTAGSWTLPPTSRKLPVSGHMHLPDEALVSDCLWSSWQMTWVLDKHSAWDVMSSQLNFVSQSPFTMYSVGEAPL